MTKKRILFLFISLIILLVVFFTFSSKKQKKFKGKKPKITQISSERQAFIADSISRVKKLGKQIDSLLKTENSEKRFNGSVLVAQNNGIIFHEQYGYADLISQTTLSDTHSFQLASVSKQFTAAAILLLQEQNKLSLHDSINQYFPHFPYKNITIEQLLHHTSGLPIYFWIAEHQWKRKTTPCHSDMICLLEEHYTVPFFTPGKYFQYSNTGYFLLAAIIEEVSEMSYPQFLEKHIFKPLNMNHSYAYRHEQDAIRATQLTGYRFSRKKYQAIQSTVNDGVVGDKNIYSTAENLHKWIVGLNSEKIISKKSLALMYKKGVLNNGKEIPYGLGFRITEIDGHELIYHNGKWNGFNTTLRQYSENDLLIIILNHTGYKKVGQLAESIRQFIVHQNTNASQNKILSDSTQALD